MLSPHWRRFFRVLAVYLVLGALLAWFDLRWIFDRFQRSNLPSESGGVPIDGRVALLSALWVLAVACLMVSALIHLTLSAIHALRIMWDEK